MDINQEELYDVAGYLLHLESVVAQREIDTASVIAGLQQARDILSVALTNNQARALKRRAQLAELQAKYPARPILSVGE
jgi:hypothetical protein